MSSSQDTFLLLNLLVLIVANTKFKTIFGKRHELLYFLSGIICCLGFYYTFDRAIYSLLTSLLVIFILINNKLLLSRLLFFLGFILTVIIILLLFGSEIIFANLSNLYFLLKEGRFCCQNTTMNYVHGAGNKALIITILIFTLNIILFTHFTFLNFNKISKKNYKQVLSSKIPEVVFLFSQLLYYRILIDVSDSVHLKLSLMFSFVFINYFFFFYISKIQK